MLDLGVRCYRFMVPCGTALEILTSYTEFELWNAFLRKIEILTCTQAKWHNRDLATLFGLHQWRKPLSPKFDSQLSSLAHCTVLLLQHATSCLISMPTCFAHHKAIPDKETLICKTHGSLNQSTTVLGNGMHKCKNRQDDKTM